MKSKYILLISIAGALIALDQLIKIYVHTHFSLNESITVIPNFFDLTYVRNKGAAFGFLSDAPPSFRDIFFLLIPPAAMIIILGVLRGVPDTDRTQISALSMVFGGAIGNYIDRLRFGYVIDFLDFHWYRAYTWPAFNVADSAIVVGICFLLLISFRRPEEDKESEKKIKPLKMKR